MGQKANFVLGIAQLPEGIWLPISDIYHIGLENFFHACSNEVKCQGHREVTHGLKSLLPRFRENRWFNLRATWDISSLHQSCELINFWRKSAQRSRSYRLFYFGCNCVLCKLSFLILLGIAWLPEGIYVRYDIYICLNVFSHVQYGG